MKSFKFFLLIASFIAVSTLWGETLFYKKNGQLITPEEHAILYPIMLETQFPTCVAFGKYEDNEIEVMNNKIKKKFGNETQIQAIYLPTTLYHLFCLRFIKENFKNIEKITDGLILHERLDRTSLSHSSNLARIKPFRFKELNFELELIKMHFTLNNYIFENLTKNNFRPPYTITDQLMMLEIFNFKRTLTLYDQTFSWSDIDKINIETIKQAIELEYIAHTQNKFILWRAIDVPDFFVCHPSVRYFNRSISFGSSLLGGILFDSTACPYFYTVHYSHNLYALMLHKKTYISGQLGNWFFIPPLISLIDLIGKGEFFHPRSKVPNLKSSSGWWDLTNNLEGMYQIQANNELEAEDTYRQMLEYIKNNHIIIKKPLSKL